MSTTIAKRVGSALTDIVRLSGRRQLYETAATGAPMIEHGSSDDVSSLRGSQEAEAIARGVIRREEMPLLARYGTSYGLFDAWIADYECVLISDSYELGAYVGDSVRVSGPLKGVIEGMPVMKVTRLELLKMKWMS